jgi:hypothetical protein
MASQVNPCRQTRRDNPSGISVHSPDHSDTDGITCYLRTMFTVAHMPGMSHWCTPGHNRGKAWDALSPDTARRADADRWPAPHAVTR